MKDKTEFQMVPSKESLSWLTKGRMLAHKALGLGRTFELEVTEQAQYRWLYGEVKACKHMAKMGIPEEFKP